MEVRGQLDVPAALNPGKESTVLLDMRLGGLQSRSGCGGEVKSNHCPCLESNPGRPARSLVTTLPELPWLLDKICGLEIRLIHVNFEVIIFKYQSGRTNCDALRLNKTHSFPNLDTADFA
jgi:hypothetical protein